MPPSSVARKQDGGAATASDEKAGGRCAEEHSVLLQVPDDVGLKLSEWLAGARDTKVEIMLGGENKTALRVDGKVLQAKLTALPTIVETHKSVDGVTFFKTGAVNQVMVVRSGAGDGEVPAPELPDGLTLPMADVRRRRWRKRPTRDPAEVEQVAVELEALRGGSLKPEYELFKKPVKVPDIAAAQPGPMTSSRVAPPSASQEPAAIKREPRAQPDTMLRLGRHPPPAPQAGPPDGSSSHAPAPGPSHLRGLAASGGSAGGGGSGAFAGGSAGSGAGATDACAGIRAAAPAIRIAAEAAKRARMEDGGAPFAPAAPARAPAPKPPPDPAALSRAQAEVQRHEQDMQRHKEQTKKIEVMLPRVSSHAERSKLQGRIDELNRLRDAARQGHEAALATLRKLQG